MSAPLKLLTANVSRIFINNQGTAATGVNLLGALSNNLQSQTVRWKKKGSRGTTRNPMKHSKSSHRGVKKYPGEYVEKGMILHTQLGLKIYPGENVGCGKDCTLFALEPGRVVITTEMLSPYPESPLYPSVKAGKVVCKQFYHILPEEQKQNFRLISQT